MKVPVTAPGRKGFFVLSFLAILAVLFILGGCGGGGSGDAELVTWHPQHGVFVWDASLLLNAATREEELDRLEEKDVVRLLVSFTSAQIRAFQKSSGDLTALADSVRGRKMALELLLGDSAWILPGRRGELADLVAFFETYPFGKIHLDLEPDKLISRNYTREQLLDELVETLEEVRKRTTRPLSLISHWRYVEEGEFDRSAEYAALLDEIVVMIYSTKTDEVARRFQRICDAGKELNVKFSLAQSVENIPAMIGRGESYFDYRLEDFLRTMETLTASVTDVSNAEDLMMQAWADYRKMK